MIILTCKIHVQGGGRSGFSSLAHAGEVLISRQLLPAPDQCLASLTKLLNNVFAPEQFWMTFVQRWKNTKSGFITYFQGLYRVLICRYYSNQQNMAWKQVPVWGQGGFFLKNGFPYTISTPPLPLWYGSKNVTILIFCKDWQFSKVSRTTSSSPWYDGLPLQI